MTLLGAHDGMHAAWPRWWRWTVIALSTLMLCSCKAPHHAAHPPGPHAPHNLPPGAAPFSPVPDAGAAVAAWPGAAGMPVQAMPMAETIVGPWAPPGIEAPWPYDEYLRDGGDRDLPVQVQPDWHVYGLETEDTIAHYDTVDGLTVVEPSNRVYLYAPRFGAVRSVMGLYEEGQVQATHGVDLPVHAARHDLNQLAVASMQKHQLQAEIGSKRATIYRVRTGDGAVSLALLPGSFQDAFLPFEDFSIIRHGVYVNAEKARLAQSIEAAIVWTDNKAVQVIIDGQDAGVVTGDQRADAVFVVDTPGQDKLRVIKVASTPVARPGDIVDFTIRFDNLGDRVIGNVTIIDNLTPRLEYVPDSAQASLKGNFVTEPNEAGSLVLRWEVEDPLPAGSGGVVRFRCRVR
jgi:uncharacterized repeat protein (TIGR01451 family)